MKNYVTDKPVWAYSGDINYINKKVQLTGFRILGSIKTKFPIKINSSLKVSFDVKFNYEIKDGCAVVDIDFDDVAANWVSLSGTGDGLVLRSESTEREAFAELVSARLVDQEWHSMVIDINNGIVELSIDNILETKLSCYKSDKASVSFSHNAFKSNLDENVSKAYYLKNVKVETPFGKFEIDYDNMQEVNPLR